MSYHVTWEDLEQIKCRRHIPDLLVKMKAKRVAEIGVREGENFRRLLVPSVELALAVDPWKAFGLISENDDELTQEELNRQANLMFLWSLVDTRIRVARCGSAYAAVLMEPVGEFDFVYIDADHTESAVYADLVMWSQLVREGGVIAGHDYRQRTLKSGVNFGVIDAISRFCAETGLKVYVDDDHPHYNWFIIKEYPCATTKNTMEDT